MDEPALRALVREVVARQLGAADSCGEVGPAVIVLHSSHDRYALPESDGPCLIEPSVRCNRCGYCESHGH